MCPDFEFVVFGDEEVVDVDEKCSFVGWISQVGCGCFIQILRHRHVDLVHGSAEQQPELPVIFSNISSVYVLDDGSEFLIFG